MQSNDSLTAAATDPLSTSPAALGGPPLAVPRRRSAIFLVGALAGGNLVARVLQIAGGILLGNVVGPEVLGRFAKFELVTGYLRFLQLGIVSGLNRELPYYVGKGDFRRVRELAGTAKAWALGSGALVVAALILYGSVPNLLHRKFEMAAGWSAIAFVAFFVFYSDSYLQATYRTASDFARLSMTNVAQNVLALLLLLPVIVLGFYGLCLRAVAVAAAGCMLLTLWQPIRVPARIQWTHWKHLFIVGFPIFLVGEMGNLWRVLDSNMVLLYLNTTALGLYKIVVQVDTATDLLPTAVGQVLYPRMAEHYGRHHDIKALIAMTHKPTLLCAAGMLPVIVVGWILADPLTHRILPKYVGAIGGMRWGIVASYVFSFSFIHNVFIVVRRQVLYFIVMLSSIAVYFVTLQFLIRQGATLAAFPQAMIAGRVAFALLGYLFVYYIAWRDNPKDRDSTS